MKNIIKKLVREWGVEYILSELISLVREDDSQKCQRLADDLENAVKRYKGDADNKKRAARR